MYVRSRTRPNRRQFRRSPTSAVIVALLATTLTACSSGSPPVNSSAATSGSNSDTKTSISFGFQTPEYPELLKASGLFDNLDYELKTPVISGPQNQIAALYAKNIDVGLVGENTAAFEWANADQDWNQAGTTPAVYEIAGDTVTNPPPDWKYPSPAVYVKSDAGVEKPADLRGKTVAYNYGGNIYAAYLLVLALGGLTEKDITPQLFDSNQLAATAFNTGDTQVVVSSYPSINALVDSGKARLLIGNDQLGVAGGSGYISRPDVLNDPNKKAALDDFFSRYSKLFSDWIPNNRDKFVEIEKNTNKQTDDIAAVNWEVFSRSRFYKVGDPAFVATQQKIVDLAFQSGSLKYKRDISNAYNPLFDKIAVPG